jgi:hypothetical protein
MSWHVAFHRCSNSWRCLANPTRTACPAVQRSFEVELVKLLYDLQPGGDEPSRDRLGDRICDMLSCISAHSFCSRLFSLRAVDRTIHEGKWARLEALAKQAVDSKVRILLVVSHTRRR